MDATRFKRITRQAISGDETSPAATPKPLPLPWDGTLTVTIDGTVFTTIWAVVNGRPAPISVTSDGTAAVTALDAATLGAVRPAVAAMLNQQAGLWRSYGQHHRARQLRKLAAAGHHSRRPRYDPRLLADIANTYNTAPAKKEHPTQTVYLAYPELLPRRLDRHIRRCRDHGLIPAARETPQTHA